MIGRKSVPVSEPADTPQGFDAFELRLGDVMRGERATMGKSLLDVQREVKIKASYLSAIETTDRSAFETSGFIAGYVRSYARYLGLDPDWAYRAFCNESTFDGVAVGLGADDGAVRDGQPNVRQLSTRRVVAAGTDPLAVARAGYVPPGEGVLSHVQPVAVASILVLVALIGALGYGGWSVLQEVQRAEFAPAGQAPGAGTTLDPLRTALGADARAPARTAQSPDILARLYRPEPLEVPVMIARDGPISALDPDTNGALVAPERLRAPRFDGPDIEPAPVIAEEAVQVSVLDAPSVEIFAVNAAWVRVSAADGTVIFEKILDAGEHYTLPETDTAPRLRAGNSGSVYFSVDGQIYGPAGAGTGVAKAVSLAAADIASVYTIAELPENLQPVPRPSVAENIVPVE